jgi:prepilin-type N-terminal cleavage/methylation domain-containing protein
MMTGRSRKRGFTLIELLVVTVLLTVVVGLLMYPLISGFTFLSKGKARQESSAATRFAMDVMTRELSNAIDVLLVQDNLIVFVLPNMRTYCPAGGGHWFEEYRYYCPDHMTGNVQHELIEPVAPMRNAEGERVAVMYYPAAGGSAAGGYLARAVVPFPDASEMDNPNAWRTQTSKGMVGSLTPTGEDFSIQTLRFAPTAVKNEVLTPYASGGNPDHSIYRSRYPLWKPGGTNFTIEVRDPDGNPVSTPLEVDVRSGTVSFAREEVESNVHAGYDPTRPLAPPRIGVFGPMVRGTEVVIGPAGTPFVRAAVISQDHPPVIGAAPREGEYWVNYGSGEIYVNSAYAGNHPPVFTVSYMRHHNPAGLSVIASYQTYALLNIDLTVRKTEAESGRAGPEGVMGKHQDFHVSSKVKILNAAR